MMETEYPDGIAIFQVRTLAEIQEWQATEALIWAGRESERHKTSLLLTLHRYGGLLLGARDATGALVGILLGFPGLKDGRLVHCSHQLGIVPAWRSKHLGYRMKCRQRDFALEQGVDLMQWTFDPLETKNAHLNLGYLGGISHQYHENLYGQMEDELNQGMESDRLTLSWHLRHAQTVTRLAGSRPSPQPADLLRSGVQVLTHVSLAPAVDGSVYLRLDDARGDGTEPIMLVEVPSNFQVIKSACLDDARAWRYGVRALLGDLFARGYAVLDLLVDNQAGPPMRCYYLIGRLDSYLSAA